MKKLELTGKKFGRLTVVKLHSIFKCKSFWECICDCGIIKIIRGTKLKSQEIKSCGCLSREVHSELATIHGLHGTRIYRIHKGMMQRCYYKNKPDYHNYGGRGIEVCKDWKDVSKFSKWAFSNGYKENLTIDRIDSNKNYTPENCQWITLGENSSKKRTTKYLTHEGKTLNLKQWSLELGLHPSTLSLRFKKNLPIDKILSNEDFRSEKI